MIRDRLSSTRSEGKFSFAWNLNSAYSSLPFQVYVLDRLGKTGQN